MPWMAIQSDESTRVLRVDDNTSFLIAAIAFMLVDIALGFRKSYFAAASVPVRVPT